MKASKLVERAVHMANVLRNSSYMERKADDYDVFQIARRSRDFQEGDPGQNSGTHHICGINQKEPYAATYDRASDNMNAHPGRISLTVSEDTKEKAAEKFIVELIGRTLVEFEKRSDEKTDLQNEVSTMKKYQKEQDKNWEERMEQALKMLHNHYADYMMKFAVRVGAMKTTYITTNFMWKQMKKIADKGSKRFHIFGQQQRARDDIKEYS